MRIVYSPETTTIEHLDFRLVCQALEDHKECPLVADWMFVMRCGHSQTFCNGHYHWVMGFLAADYILGCRICRIDTQVVNSWRIT